MQVPALGLRASVKEVLFFVTAGLTRTVSQPYDVPSECAAKLFTHYIVSFGEAKNHITQA